MTSPLKILSPLLLLLNLIVSQHAFAGGGHEHGEKENAEQDHAAEQETGPHGGRLLKSDHLAVELTIQESGIPPEFRVWVYQEDKPVAPFSVEISVELARLGGRTDRITFSPEQDYLVSDQSIDEPHSFDVSVVVRVGDEAAQWHFDSHEGRTEISARAAAQAGLQTAQAGPATLRRTVTLFGRLRASEEQVHAISARYPGMVQQVLVSEGDRVSRGDVVARIETRDTLQLVSVRAPADGIIRRRYVNPGMAVDAEPLVEIVNTDVLWLDLDAFPQDQPLLQTGQQVLLHNEDQREPIGTLKFIAPVAEAHTRSTLARAVVENRHGQFRAGTLVKADVVISQREVPLAVRAEALQTYMDKPVVFARFDDIYEVRMIEIGARDNDWLEVLGGIEPGTTYVTANSFLVKADILKSGASHAH
jgi:membrane fusion protein, heavy metal efflux system